MTTYCYCFGKRFINALFLAIYSLVLLRFVSVLLKRIDCILFSALLAHLHTNFCASNTMSYLRVACAFHSLLFFYRRDMASLNYSISILLV